jgi:hypothetical protein
MSLNKSDVLQFHEENMFAANLQRLSRRSGIFMLLSISFFMLGGVVREDDNYIHIA